MLTVSFVAAALQQSTYPEHEHLVIEPRLRVPVLGQQDAFHDEERDGKLQMTAEDRASRTNTWCCLVLHFWF